MAEIQNKKLWTEEEDQTLKKAVSLINNDKWNIIAKKFQELYLQTHGMIIRRAGKQCRERQFMCHKLYRWYNKLHPNLSKTVVPWSDDESVVLLSIYQEMGPKWAKIIYRLCELGYDRRSDNNIKNHFHTIVKKSLKNLNQFIEQYNKKTKQTIIPNKVKKIYIYEKTYSIEKQMRKQLQKKIAENDQMEGSNNERMDDEENGCEKGQKGRQQIDEDGKFSQGLFSQLKQQQHQQALVVTNKQSRMSSQLLRVIDKKSIDRLWLWSAHKQSGRLQIISPAIEDAQLLSARNCFIDYMKNPQSFTHQQTKQLIYEINNYSKCCKKLNKKKRDKFIKEKQDKTKYYIDKVAKRMFACVVTERPEMRRMFMKNKGEIMERIVFLVTVISNKCAMFMDEEEREKGEIISKKQQQKIIKQILQQFMETQQDNNSSSIEKIDKVEIQPEHGKQNTIDVGIQTIELKNIDQQQLKQQKLVKATFFMTQKVKKIRKYNKKKPSEESKSNKQTNGLIQDVVIVKQEQNQPLRQYPLLTLPLMQSQLKIQQSDFGMFAFETIQQINSQQSGSMVFGQKQKQRNNKVRESNLGEVKVEDSFQSVVKMAEESQKTTEVNMLQRNHAHHQHLKQQQTHINCQFNRPFEEKHIESEPSQYSVGTKKSIRPNRNIFKEEKKFGQEQEEIKNKGSFGEIEKIFHHNSEVGQEVHVDNSWSNCINPFGESEQMVVPQTKQQLQSNYTFINQLPQSQNPFIACNPFPLSTDPFCVLTNSRQFLMSNSPFSHQVGSSQYQVIQKPKTPYNSHEFLELSCKNPFKGNNVQENVSYVDIQKQCSSQQNINVNSGQNDQQGNFLNNSFFENIRNVEDKSELQWKQPKVFDFEQQKGQVPFPYSRQSREIHHFNSVVSQPLDFEIPQKLIDCAKNPLFPIKNYNDYSLNYQHANSLQYSKIFELEKSFGLNSARLSQIDLFRSQERSSSHRSGSKDHEGSSNMFKSQRINSVHDSCQFSRSRHLSNSCAYSNNENKPYGSAKQIAQNSRT